jgi:hypothetical protein
MVQKRASRFKSDIRIKPDKKEPVREEKTRMCEAPDCVGAGNCRVPRSPQNLSEYYWYQMPLGGLNDSHAMFAEDGETQTARRPERHLTRLQAIAMDTLQLAHNATLIEIKARYKELVKRFHPDANGGDRGAEERLKQVIKAYGVLRASGLLT